MDKYTTSPDIYDSGKFRTNKNLHIMRGNRIIRDEILRKEERNGG